MNNEVAKKLMTNIKEKYILGRQPFEYADMVVIMKIIEDILDKIEARDEQQKVIETL